jgi:hypothetical protein
VRRRVGRDRGDDLVDRAGVTDGGAGQLDAAPQRVHVPVAEPRQQSAAVEVDDLGAIRLGHGLVVERDDDAVPDQSGRGRQPVRVERAYGPPAEEHQGGFGHASMLDMTCLTRV